MASRMRPLGAKEIHLILAVVHGSFVDANMTCLETTGPSLQNVTTIIGCNILLAVGHMTRQIVHWSAKSWSFVDLPTSRLEGVSAGSLAAFAYIGLFQNSSKSSAIHCKREGNIKHRTKSSLSTRSLILTPNTSSLK
jgi:hypothetical protein